MVTSRQAGAAGRKAGARRRGTWAREKIYICYSMLLCTKRETRAVSRSRCLHHAPPLPPPPPPCVVRSSKARLKTTDSIGFSASACAGFACSHGTETFNALEYCKAQPHHQQWSRISDASTHARTQARKHASTATDAQGQCQAAVLCAVTTRATRGAYCMYCTYLCIGFRDFARVIKALCRLEGHTRNEWQLQVVILHQAGASCHTHASE